MLRNPLVLVTASKRKVSALRPFTRTVIFAGSFARAWLTRANDIGKVKKSTAINIGVMLRILIFVFMISPCVPYGDLFETELGEMVAALPQSSEQYPAGSSSTLAVLS